MWDRLKLFGPLIAIVVVAVATTQVAPTVSLVVAGLGIPGWLIVVSRRSQRGAVVNNRGLTLMSEGRLVEAIAALEEAKGLLVSPLPTFNIGMASLWLWRLDEARTQLEKSTSTRAGRPLRVIATPALFFIANVQNDAARTATYEAELKPLGAERSSVVHIGRAVRFARDRNWREVLNALSLSNTRPLGGPARAVADALRAWATVELGGTCPPIDHVGVFGETGPAAVRVWWPEFADFLERTAGAQAT